MTIETFSFPGSSNLASATFDDETEQLTVTFLDGDTYAGKVPQGIAEGLKNAGSAGQYYNRQIRNRFVMEKQ